jgi:type IV secretion system protein VirD4
MASAKAAPLALKPRLPAAPPPEPKPCKTLSLGEQPSAPSGESCDVREILAAAAQEQDHGFDAMKAVLREASDPKVRQAIETLGALHSSFGDDGK